MGEIKSVKVDNWGVFFLQKLQNFFNKTDYCDLTLQFRDNSQLKVHRLVLSACTDYFNVLENTCEVVDDALIMPNELQADVVVPIVNFMYTGTLEFELRMYGKLLRTAKEMNMTVLLKLLEAHRRTMEGVNRSQRPPSPKPIRRRGPLATAQPGAQAAQQQQQQNQLPARKIITSSNASAALQQQQERRVAQARSTATNTVQTPIRQVGQTTLMRTTSSANSGTSQLNQFKQESGAQQSPCTFEQLRKGYNNNKRPASVNFVAPPSKKPNIEDVKEFAEQQRMRKEIAAEYGEDHDFEGMMEDDIHADDDDDDPTTTNSLNASGSSATANKSQQQQQPPPQIGETTITFKHEGDKPPTIVVKDNTNSKVNHAKIITEVLRQYPHLAKSNKNIKLKIMPNAGGQAQKIIVKREQVDSSINESVAQKQIAPVPKPTATSSQTPVRSVEKQNPTLSTNQQAQKKLQTQQKTPIGAVQKPSVTTVSPQTMHTTPSTGNASKRRIDSKTMHSLIALGAENTTGPWLCLRCGVNGRPISIPTYRGFRRHLINTHKEVIDAALCEHCGWRSKNNRELHFHMQVEHKMRSTLYSYPECLLCAELFLDNNNLNQHMLNSHPNSNKQQCIYCNKIFGEESQLYTHMKAYHKRQALEDGIIDYSDEEYPASHDESELDAHHTSAPKKKASEVKILSDISLPISSSFMKERSSEAAALSTVASGIATSIAITSTDGTEEFISAVETDQETGTSVTKFVNADGNEMVLTDELRKEIMSQLNQDHEAGSGGVVMVLNENAYPGDEATTETTTSEMEEHLEEEAEQHDSSLDEGDVTAADERTTPAEDDEYDDSQIYGEFISQESTETATKKPKENLDESKESVENMEWAESLLSAHDMEEESKTEEGETTQSTSEDKSKRDDDISKKLKELTGDWSEDENEEEEHAEEEVQEADDSATVAEEGDSADALEKPRSTSASSEKIENTSTKPADNVEKADDKKVLEESTEKANTDIEETPMEEDDLELAMENLHKEDADPKTSAISGVSKEVSPQQVSLADEKSGEPASDAELKEANEPDETKQKSNATADVGDNIEEKKPEVKVAEPEDDDVKNEDLATALLDEFITEKAVSVEGGVDSKEPVDEKPAQLEEITAAPNDAIKEEDLDDSKEKLNESNVEDADEVKEEFIELKEESSTQEVAATPTPEKSDTAENMKSLISEWADDDDDEEEIPDTEEI